MTELEWMECGDPTSMLELSHGKISDRKFRLFACACLRRIWGRCDEKLPREVDVSERFADGGIDRRELAAVRSPLGARGGYSAAWAASCAVHSVLDDRARTAAARAVVSAVDFVYYSAIEKRDLTALSSGQTAIAKREIERSQLTTLVRDIFGNPFRPVTLDPRWLSSTVFDLARTIYDERAFERMPILADALMDAGCDSEEVIKHCQGPGPHVRGCWVVDLLLKKE